MNFTKEQKQAQKNALINFAKEWIESGCHDYDTIAILLNLRVNFEKWQDAEHNIDACIYLAKQNLASFKKYRVFNKDNSAVFYARSEKELNYLSQMITDAFGNKGVKIEVFNGDYYVFDHNYIGTPRKY